MKKIPAILVFAVIVCLAFTSYGQSNKGQPTAGGKANKRPAEASPTPTPIPESVTPADGVSATVADDEIIKVSTQLVSIPVRVMDKRGRFIGGLAKENFKVFENGEEQEIALFSNENEPFTVALVLDMSYSTTFKLSEIQSAAIAFIDQLRPQDKVMVVSFDEEVHILCEATSDRKEIYRAIRSTKISTGTSLYEAMGLVMNDKLQKIDGRKAIILFTDGVDTTSRRTYDGDNLRDAMELDALIYPIRYDTFADVQSMKNGPIIRQPPIEVPTSGGQSPAAIILQGISRPSDRGTTTEEYAKAREYLDQLSIRTGGRLYEASSLTNLADAYTKIASELREFYSLGFYPKEDRIAGKRASIKVKVDKEGLAVKTRETLVHRKKSK